MVQTLIKQKKFYGKYVALKDFNDRKPIADGKNPDEVYALALKRGCLDPMIVYIPMEGMVHIYVARCC